MLLGAAIKTIRKTHGIHCVQAVIDQQCHARFRIATVVKRMKDNVQLVDHVHSCIHKRLIKAGWQRETVALVCVNAVVQVQGRLIVTDVLLPNNAGYCLKGSGILLVHILCVGTVDGSGVCGADIGAVLGVGIDVFVPCGMQA
jgi:hypothetical protein